MNEIRTALQAAIHALMAYQVDCLVSHISEKPVQQLIGEALTALDQLEAACEVAIGELQTQRVMQSTNSVPHLIRESGYDRQ